MKLTHMLSVVLVVLLVAAVSAQAGIIDLDLSPREQFRTNTEGDARGIYFQATQDFSIISVGMYAWLKDNRTFDVLVYSVTDGVADQVLASSINQLPYTHASQPSEAWNDIALNFDFQSGKYYIVHWRPNDGIDNWVHKDNVTDSRLQVFQFASGDPTDVTVLPKLTVLRGRSGPDALSVTNTVPHMRFNGIPEPTTLTLLTAAGMGLLLRRQRPAV